MLDWLGLNDLVCLYGVVFCMFPSYIGSWHTSVRGASNIAIDIFEKHSIHHD